MFKSATLKLTVWYAGSIICISLLFSVLIYSIASTEVGSQIDYYTQESLRQYSSLDTAILQKLHDSQINKANSNLISSLIFTNICIWLAGGIGSYYLARRTLHPIEEVHEAQSRFTSDASHELRTPLASMKLELEVALRDASLSKQEMRSLLGSNLEEVNKLTKLSQTLLQLSRLDHDNIIREKVDLAVVVTDVIDRLKASDRVKITNLHSLHVFANELSVEELLTILLDNALKYSPSNSTVHITLIKRKSMAGFEVTNSGEGISADVLPHIFDRFYRVDSSRTSGDKKGYGLGLSLAKKIVELHSGELTVSSAPQHDTTFTVLLPGYSQVKRIVPQLPH